ncbi:MAG: leucyl aminopeptidase, partial [Lachnospiraceae bacterium]|nr:leucyl aminopeptidase [Lachnospiraceae bacterium]
MMEKERFLLAKNRIQEIKDENLLQPEFQEYFKKMAEFVGLICDTWTFVSADGPARSSITELKERNYRLYEDILPENYQDSYGNPACSVRKLGEGYGQLLSFLYAELRGMIPFVYEKRQEDGGIRMELLLEIYSSFCCEQAENGRLPEYET